MVVCWGSLCAERKVGGGAFQFYKLKVIFSNISSILINYPERLSKLLFEYFMALHVNVSRTKCYTLLFNNASSVRIYLWNLCSLRQRRRGDRPGVLWIIRRHRSRMRSIPQQKECLSGPDFKSEINKVNGEIDELHFLRTCEIKLACLDEVLLVFLEPVAENRKANKQMPSNQTKTNFAKLVLGMWVSPWAPCFTKYAVRAAFFCLCL